ncbi:hypothetical protein LX32DRAFT_111781 [Colletotrichum zoysiae]|uniref:Uncharacterized protein n=1 Tax=Colletotrichum zoysiae TaxID=1216348 RepID=A0AAD9H8I3_9PEZI|nr:hypothetical protein LX32DRAFT_111781 [Colletotrichum zoysiae]
MRVGKKGGCLLVSSPIFSKHIHKSGLDDTNRTIPTNHHHHANEPFLGAAHSWGYPSSCTAISNASPDSLAGEWVRQPLSIRPHRPSREPSRITVLGEKPWSTTRRILLNAVPFAAASFMDSNLVSQPRYPTPSHPSIHPSIPPRSAKRRLGGSC